METVLLKIPVVMERLAVGQTKLYELMSSGGLRSVKVGEGRVRSRCWQDEEAATGEPLGRG